MTESERIEAMVQEGRLTREEADRLLNVLSDIDDVEAQLEDRPAAEADAVGARAANGAADREERRPPANEAGPGGGAMAGSAVPPTEPKEAREHESRRGAAHAGVPWVEVDLVAGDVRVKVDESLSAPVASSSGNGQSELEATEDGYRFRGKYSGDSLIDRIVGSVKTGRTELSIPPGHALRLKMKAGHVDIKGPVPFLAGSLLAADLDADEVHGVDLTVSAGDVDLGLRLSEGDHRIKGVAGDLTVRLLPGSDVTVSGRVNIGDLSLPNGWNHGSRGLGSDFDHRLGSGRARLNVELGTGDLDVEAPRD